MTSDAIIACYQGDHRLCLSQSTVCMGDSDNNWLVKSEYLPYFFKLKVKIGSEKVLRDCIDYRLGASIVEKTKLNSNSQKVESVNNVIRHLPGIFQEGLIVQSSNATMVPERQY